MINLIPIEPLNDMHGALIIKIFDKIFITGGGWFDGTGDGENIDESGYCYGDNNGGGHGDGYGDTDGNSDDSGGFGDGYGNGYDGDGFGNGFDGSWASASSASSGPFEHVTQ